MFKKIYDYGTYPLIWFSGLFIWGYFSNPYTIFNEGLGWTFLISAIILIAMPIIQMSQSKEKTRMLKSIYFQMIVFFILTILLFCIGKVSIFQNYEKVRTPLTVKVYELNGKYNMDCSFENNEIVTFYFPKFEAYRLSKLTDVSKFTITTEYVYSGELYSKYYKTDREYSKKVHQVILLEIGEENE